MKIDRLLAKRVKETWLTASKKLNFEITSPFKFIFNNEEKTAFAFLPAYGSEKGMVIDLIAPPKFEIDNEIIKWSELNGHYYSFINAESYLEYNEDFFIETLNDWGKYKNG